MRRSLSLLVLTTLLGTFAAAAPQPAAAPVEADPSKDYFVIPEAGEWMVLIAYYTGPDAATLARNMCYTIRSRLNRTAYVFVHIDEDRERQKKELDAANRLAEQLMKESGATPVKLRKPTVRAERQYAVLIGGWADDKTANVALNAIRAVKPEAVLGDALAKGKIETDTYLDVERDAKGQPIKDASGQPKYVRRRVNPFSTAIVTRNPVIPQQRVAKAADPILKKFNANEEYSLLSCPKPYTLLVKEYTGAAALENARDTKDGGFLSAIGLGGNQPGEALDAAAKQAHEMARVLRQLKFDAYVLHTRGSSVVTIGGFEGANDPGAERVAQQLALLRQKVIAERGSDLLQLYTPPLAMEIPRP